MATQKRPLSPHLQVYRPQITTVLSILHRATGVFNALGALLLAVWLLALAANADTYDCAQYLLSSLPGQLVLAAFMFSLIYHFFNGIRHLLWDTGWGYELPKVYASGYTVVILSLLSTALLYWCAFSGGGL